jgi:protease PrsW
VALAGLAGVLFATLAPLSVVVAILRRRIDAERLRGPLVRTWLLGMLVPVIAGVIEIPALLLAVGLHRALGSGVIALIVATALIGLIEEVAKYLFLRNLVLRREPMQRAQHALLYAIAIGCAFATLENAVYVGAFALAGRIELLVAVALLRSVLPFPMHVHLAIFMGWYVARAEMESIPAIAAGLRRRAWLIPAGVHALYDFLIFGAVLSGLTVVGAAAGLAFVIVVAAMWIAAVRVFRSMPARPIMPVELVVFDPPSPPGVALEENLAAWSRPLEPPV